MRIWFNKTFSTIQSVFRNLREAVPSGEIQVICTHTFASAAAFKEADEAYLEPSELAGLAYLQWCLAFCKQYNIALFWPGKEAALISNNQSLFDEIGVRIVAVADYATLTLINHKANFYADVPPDVALVMDFRAVNDCHRFDQAVGELALKHERLCVKPAVSVYGLGFKVLDIQRDSVIHLLKGVEYQIPLQELRQGMENTPSFDTLLVMEYLGGHEWSVDCAAREGVLLCAVQRKKALLAGHGQLIDNNADIDGMVSRLTAHYRLNGLFNIQFKEGSRGIRLLEINPRPSGGFGMACLAGVNLAKIALQAINGEQVKPPVINYGLKVTEVNTPIILQEWA